MIQLNDGDGSNFGLLLFELLAHGLIVVGRIRQRLILLWRDSRLISLRRGNHVFRLVGRFGHPEIDHLSEPYLGLQGVTLTGKFDQYASLLRLLSPNDVDILDGRKNVFPDGLDCSITRSTISRDVVSANRNGGDVKKNRMNGNPNYF